MNIVEAEALRLGEQVYVRWGSYGKQAAVVVGTLQLRGSGLFLKVVRYRKNSRTWNKRPSWVTLREILDRVPANERPVK